MGREEIPEAETCITVVMPSAQRLPYGLMLFPRFPLNYEHRPLNSLRL